MVTRLTRQKGLDLLFETLPNCSRAMTCGSWRSQRRASLRTVLHGLQERFPGRAVCYSGYSEELAHFIEAASDMFLMPSMYEPCGLNQMYSLKYGTVPIVRRTGGLADSVQHFDPVTGQGTGIVFNDYDPDGVRWALSTALRVVRLPSVLAQADAERNAQDFSWTSRAQIRRTL